MTSYDVARADGFPADRLPGLYLRSSVNSTTLLARGATRIVRHQSNSFDVSNPSNPSAKGASGNFGASEQWAGRVCSVASQIHTNICVAAKTVPILAAFRLRRGPWERATRPRMACAEIGTVCSSGSALQRIGRVKALYLSPKTLAASPRHDRFDKSEKCDIIRGPCEGEILTVKELRVSSPYGAPRCRGKAYV